MKTPREILLTKHRSAEPSLDKVRRIALTELQHSEASAPRLSAQTAGRSSNPTWRDFFLSFRWHLAGLSAAWLLVLLLNIDRPAASPTVSAQNQSPSAQQRLAALRENRRQVRELTGTSVVETQLPTPHSDLRGSPLPRREAATIRNEILV